MTEKEKRVTIYFLLEGGTFTLKKECSKQATTARIHEHGAGVIIYGELRVIITSLLNKHWECEFTVKLKSLPGFYFKDGDSITNVFGCVSTIFRRCWLLDDNWTTSSR